MFVIFFFHCYFQYQQWIDDERIYLLKRIEKLEHDNHQLLELYQTYQIENEKSIQSIMNLILKILLTQQVKYP
jgi:adenylate kinase family enzyme